MVIEKLLDLWQVDRERMVRTETGFDWWPGQNRVSVKTLKATSSEALGTWKLTITTDFAKGVDLDDKVRQAGLALLSGFCPTYGMIYFPAEVRKENDLPADGRVFLSSSAYIRQDMVAWLPTLLSGLAILQAIDADRQSKSASAFLGGSVDQSSPRGTSPDSHHDEMLDLWETFFGPASQGPNRFGGLGEYEEFTKVYAQNDNCFGMGDPTGMTLETPLGEESILIRLKTDEEHPNLGVGLLVSMKLPFGVSEAEAIEQCTYLNLMETLGWTSVPQLGSWHPRQLSAGGDYAPAYSSFIPNAVFSPGLVTNLALWQLGRATWVKQTLYSELTHSPMSEILQKRFG